MQLCIIGMITYHAQYMCSYKLSMITYNIFSDRLIFPTRGFHSKYNYLISQSIFILHKQDTETQIQIQIIFITESYSNYTYSLALRTLLLS